MKGRLSGSTSFVYDSLRLLWVEMVYGGMIFKNHEYRKKSLEGKLPPEHGFLVPELTSQSDGPAKGPDFSQTIFSKIARNYV